MERASRWVTGNGREPFQECSLAFMITGRLTVPSCSLLASSKRAARPTSPSTFIHAQF